MSTRTHSTTPSNAVPEPYKLAVAGSRTSAPTTVFAGLRDLVLCRRRGLGPSVEAMGESAAAGGISQSLPPSTGSRDDSIDRLLVADGAAGYWRMAATSCRVVNKTSGASAVTDLQRALDRADAGDRIRVAGVCRGNFLVERDVTLLGRTSDTRPRAVLVAARERHVVRSAATLPPTCGSTAWLSGEGLPSAVGASGFVSGATLRADRSRAHCSKQCTLWRWCLRRIPDPERSSDHRAQHRVQFGRGRGKEPDGDSGVCHDRRQRGNCWRRHLLRSPRHSGRAWRSRRQSGPIWWWGVRRRETGAARPGPHRKQQGA